MLISTDDPPPILTFYHLALGLRHIKRTLTWTSKSLIHDRVLSGRCPGNEKIKKIEVRKDNKVWDQEVLYKLVSHNPLFFSFLKEMHFLCRFLEMKNGAMSTKDYQTTG